MKIRSIFHKGTMLLLLACVLTPMAAAHPLRQSSKRLSSHPMYISFGLSGLTYIGNEDVSSARFNGVMPGLCFEWGYSLTPEIAFSFNLNAFTAQMQTRYRLNPFVDFSQETVGSDGNWPYCDFNMYGVAVTGQLTLDWTNIISGRDYHQARLHVLTPLGMGVTVASGKKKNPWTDYKPLNNEFTLTAGVAFEYQLNSKMKLFFTPRMYIHRGSLDYSPYSNNESSKVDIMPMVNIGAKFTLNARIPWITR